MAVVKVMGIGKMLGVIRQSAGKGSEGSNFND
jgi:hypothetical protein